MRKERGLKRDSQALLKAEVKPEKGCSSETPSAPPSHVRLVLANKRPLI